jgi:hypothetical protein
LRSLIATRSRSIERAIAASGHEAVLYRPGSELPEVDVMLFEPSMGHRVIALAKVLTTATPPVPLVAVGIHPPELAVHELRPGRLRAEAVLARRASRRGREGRARRRRASVTRSD